MALFDQLYQKLFNGKGNDTSKLLHEVIERSEKYLTSYNRWKTDGSAAELLSAYGRSYHFKRSGMQSEPVVHVFSSPASNGFALTYSAEISKRDFQFLFDFLAEKTRMLGYRMVNSDVQISEKDDVVETKEKHYLKPPHSRGTGSINQHFGNILVEYIALNDDPTYIKVLANIYSDRLYEEPRDHQELIEHLFSTN